MSVTCKKKKYYKFISRITNNTLPTLPIKPLSVNEAWQGRRFKTPKYQRYERDVMLILPKAIHIPEGPLFLVYIFGMSNTLSDCDNPVKPLQDILQKKYNFNDSRIAGILVLKEKVSKGKEFTHFTIMANPKSIGEILRDIEIVRQAALRDPTRADTYRSMEQRYQEQVEKLQAPKESDKRKPVAVKKRAR